MAHRHPKPGNHDPAEMQSFPSPALYAGEGRVRADGRRAVSALSARTLVAISFFCLSLHATVSAQSPHLKNGDVVESPLTGTLESTISSLVGKIDEPAWIGYSVKPKSGVSICSGNWEQGRQSIGRLERTDDGLSVSTDDEDDGEMIVDRRLLVLLRVDNRAIERIRVYTNDCPLDAGHRTLFWLGEASTNESIRYLEQFVTEGKLSRSKREERDEKAVSAIACHDDAAAAESLQRLYRKAGDEELRGNIVFWIGQTGGEAGVKFLGEALHSDPDSEVREQIIFAISQDESQYAVEALIQIARHDPDPDLRSKALFWLSQKASHKAGEALREAAIDDPDLEVKKQAVFALSQLSPDEGIPYLIEVARSNKHPEIRESAIFWLGQSEDPRVLTFFEEILSK